MTGRKFSIVAAMTAATFFGFAAQAFADGPMEAAAAMPVARVMLALASVVFTAALARGAVR